MEKTQCQRTTAITDTHQQAASPSEADFSEIDLTLYHHLLAGLHGTHGCNPGTVFVACRQVKQHILKSADIQPLQAIRDSRAYALEHRDRQGVEIVGGLTQGIRPVFTTERTSAALPATYWYGVTRRVPLAASQLHDRIHFHLRTSRQCGHTNRRAGRIGFTEVLGHDFIDQGEVTEIGKKDVQLDDIGQ